MWFGFQKYRSSRLKMYFRVGVLKNFAMFIEKHLCWRLSLDKYAGLKVCNFIKKRLQHSFFRVKYETFLRTSFFTEHVRLLLLEISHEPSLYCIWEQWMGSFCGTNRSSSAFFILPRVFCFFLFLSFFFFPRFYCFLILR